MGVEISFYASGQYGKTLLKLVTFREIRSEEFLISSCHFCTLIFFIPLTSFLICFISATCITIHSHIALIACVRAGTGERRVLMDQFVQLILRETKGKAFLLLFIHRFYSFSESASLGLVERMKGCGVEKREGEWNRRLMLFPRVLVYGTSTEESEKQKLFHPKRKLSLSFCVCVSVCFSWPWT